MELNKLKIENPCPVALLAMRKDGDSYHCRYCSKTVIDFRNKTNEEAMVLLTPGSCGIFNSDQLPAQPKPNFSMKIKLAVLAVFSVLGFNVNVAAQTTTNQQPPKTVQKQPVKPSGKEPLPVCPKSESPQKQEVAPVPKKPRVFRTTGCPSF